MTELNPKNFYTGLDHLYQPLLIRAQIEALSYVERILRDEISFQPNALKVDYALPEAGWLDTDIYIDGKKALSFSFSAWDNSVMDLRNWLEGLTYDQYDNTIVSLYHADCERNDVVFYGMVYARERRIWKRFLS